ncbi:ATPase component BioM of energizing module of biotin ECF transporter [hydrothermal vent metagenome]|uniref:ATPase component BioM of energizing module of biotin ECF transporter n=1 Tax=hydrothermal vent metagenome TaxID=652676 RepID=A0A3B0TIM6_9ZZZZ
MLKDGELRPDSHQQKIVEMLQKLHDDLVGYEEKVTKNNGFLRRVFAKKNQENFPKGLYVHGDVGRGKSMIMDLFFAAAPVRSRRRVHFHAFMLEIHQAMHDWRYMDGPTRLALHGTDMDDPILPLARKIAGESLLLCFDEFQVSDVTDAMILGRLFSNLFDLGVVMVLTSNRPPDDLYSGGLNRALFLPSIDLIKEKLSVVSLSGPTDYRMERMKGVKTYYHPLGEEATKSLSKAFWRLTDHEVADRSKVGPQELQVQGRTVHVPVADKGVAVFSFKKLCGAALGAADFLAIAWQYHTVIMVGIPRLGAEHRNEAKRFVTFIDVLYENNVKFLCCAEVPPHDLYPHGHGHFEFQRTVSRLMEMQSQQYLAKGHAV